MSASIRRPYRAHDAVPRLVENPPPIEMIYALVRAPATLTIVGSNWLTGSGWTRLRALQQAHALEPLVSRCWPRTPGPWKSLIHKCPLTHLHDVWLGVTEETEAAIAADQALVLEDA